MSKRYRLLKEPINKNMKRLGQTYKSISLYMTEAADANWLNNRTSRARTTLVEYKEAEKLAWFLGVNVDDIADEIDDASYKTLKKETEYQKPDEIIIAPQISEEQWTRLEELITNAVSKALKNK